MIGASPCLASAHAARLERAAANAASGVVLPRWSAFVSSLDPGRVPRVPAERVAA